MAIVKNGTYRAHIIEIEEDGINGGFVYRAFINSVRTELTGTFEYKERVKSNFNEDLEGKILTIQTVYNTAVSAIEHKLNGNPPT